MKPNEIKYSEFMGVKIDNVHFEQIYETIKKNIHHSGYISLTDVGNVISASKDKELLEAINGSILSVADGMPLAWYGKLLGSKKIERISGAALMQRLLEEENGFKHYLLGDTERTIRKVIEKARKHNTTIQISGYSPPFKRFSKEDNQRKLNKINEEKPDIVWVSFGGGKQEKWMRENIRNLNRGIMIGVGAAFRFYIGDIKTPPKILQDLGFQWFFRFIQNPIRTGRRQVITFPLFIIRFPWEVIESRRKGRSRRKAH